MPKYLILLFFTTFLFSCKEKNRKVFISEPDSKVEIPNIKILKTDSSLHLKNGVLYQDSTLFSGYILEKEDTIIISSTGYFNGLKEDSAFKYYPDGNKLSTRFYKKGKKHGRHFGWYPDGTLKFDYLFKNGLNEGNHKTWYKNGQLYKDQNYKNGHELGRQKIYRTDGKIRANYIIKENGEKYGLSGLKRCKKVETEDEKINW